MPAISEVKDADSILLGLGVFGLAPYAASPGSYTDVGYIKGARFNYSRELKDFESGGILIKRIAFRDRFGCTVDWAEVSLSNLSKVIPGGLSGNSFSFGGEKSITRYAARFEHPRDDGDLLQITIYRTIPGGEFELAFAEEDFITYPVEFQAEADASEAVGRQYGKIVLVNSAAN